MTEDIMGNTDKNSTLSLWLLWLCTLVIVMIAVGGVTRLTESGLSIVEWEPMVGIVPPLNDVDWNIVYYKYKNSPQYKKVNAGMSLPEFKKIFYWEYAHRLIARLLGVFFLFPYLYFLLAGKIPKGFRLKIFLGFLLGGLQGFLGWFMVKSGLVDYPEVSHYRLSAHLLMAFLILGYLYWVYLQLKFANAEVVHEMEARPFRLRLHFLSSLFTVQIIYGALMAGLNAGYAYNTFPLMDGSWMPAAFWDLSPWWANLFDNIAGVQFVHRMLGWIILFLAFVVYIHAHNHIADTHVRWWSGILVMLVVLQFLLGVVALLSQVFIPVAVWHQVNAALVFLALVHVHFHLRRVT